MAQPTNADPGHTTMVYHQQPGQISQHPTPATPGCSESYNGDSGRATGWIQLCCAVGMTMVGVAQFLLGSSLRFIACGIWMSLLCFGPAGVLGIVSFRKRTRVISAYITMSVFSAIFAFFMMIIGAIGASIGGSEGCYALTVMIPCREGLKEFRTASDGIMGVIGLIELIVAIVGSVYGCSGVCCGRHSTRPLQELNLVNQYPAIASTHQQCLSYVSTDHPPSYSAAPQQLQQTYPQQHTRRPQQTFPQQTNPSQQTRIQQTPTPQQIHVPQQTFPNQQTRLQQQTPTPQQVHLPQQTFPNQQTFQHQQTHPQQETNAIPRQTYPHQGYQALILPNNQGR